MPRQPIHMNGDWFIYTRLHARRACLSDPCSTTWWIEMDHRKGWLVAAAHSKLGPAGHLRPAGTAHARAWRAGRARSRRRRGHDDGRAHSLTHSGVYPNAFRPGSPQLPAGVLCWRSEERIGAGTRRAQEQKGTGVPLLHSTSIGSPAFREGIWLETYGFWISGLVTVASH